MKITDAHRIELTKLYQRQIARFGLLAWKRHSKKIVAAAHRRISNGGN